MQPSSRYPRIIYSLFSLDLALSTAKGNLRQYLYLHIRGTIQNKAWAVFGDTGKRKHLKDDVLPKIASHEENVHG